MELLSERPGQEITVRDITTRAHANVAAVGYHFGGKDELVVAALRGVIERITYERRRALEALPEDADLASVVRAWLAPALLALRGEEGEGADWRVLAQSFLSPGMQLASLAEEQRPEVEATLVRRLAALLPHLDPDELAWRHAATLGLAGFLGAGGRVLLGTPGDERAAERFVAYVVGALSAPASRPARD